MPGGGKDRAKVYIGFTWGLHGVNDLFEDLRCWGVLRRTVWGLMMQERL